MQSHVKNTPLGLIRRTAGPLPEPIGQRAFYLIRAGCTEIIVNDLYERENYPFYTLEYVVSGSGVLEVADTRYALHTGMELARRMLCEWGLSVSETAYRLGFYDPYHFSRTFKRRTGVSPSRAAGSPAVRLSRSTGVSPVSHSPRPHPP